MKLSAAILLLISSLPAFSQQAAQPSPEINQQQAPPSGQTLSTDQLNDLVAPVALYPDPLLSQILVASTYPLELVQLQQWLDRNPSITGTALVQAVEEQNWDPSIQAMAVFPDLVKRLNQDITWTTNLGNTFLIQQADVMDAVQRMRAQAQQGGKLVSSAEQTVTNNTDNGQPVIQIQPANPQVVSVPYYDPYYIWGPSYYYPYARWSYPPFYGGGYYGFGYGIRIGAFFGGGWGGWGGWGWSPGWGSRTIIVNNNFITRNNFNRVGYAGGRVNGTGAWAHNSIHRQSVPYNNVGLNSRFNSGPRQNIAGQNMQASGRFGAQRFNNTNRGFTGGTVRNGNTSRQNFSSGSANRSNNFSARPSTGSRGFSGGGSSAPRGFSGGGSAPRASGGGGGGFRGGGGGGGGFRGGGGGSGGRGGGGRR